MHRFALVGRILGISTARVVAGSRGRKGAKMAATPPQRLATRTGFWPLVKSAPVLVSMRDGSERAQTPTEFVGHGQGSFDHQGRAMYHMYQRMVRVVPDEAAPKLPSHQGGAIRSPSADAPIWRGQGTRMRRHSARRVMRCLRQTRAAPHQAAAFHDARPQSQEWAVVRSRRSSATRGSQRASESNPGRRRCRRDSICERTV